MFHAVLVLTFALVLWEDWNSPAADPTPPDLATTHFLLLGCVYVARLVFWLFSSSRSMQRLWAWPVAPVITAGAILLVGSDMPERVRFEFSQSEFDRAVTELEDRQFAEGLLVRDPGPIGSYEICSITKVGDAVIFTEPCTDYYSVYGLIFAPDGPPSEWNEVWSPTVTDLGDDWYAFHD